MRTVQHQYTKEKGWQGGVPLTGEQAPQLVLVFGETALLKDSHTFTQLKAWYPAANVVGCSTSGEIQGTELKDDAIIATAVHFDKSQVEVKSVSVANAEGSEAAGTQLAEAFKKEGLRHVMVFSEGLNVNGTQLVKGLRNVVGAGVVVTGGLAGDQANFKETVVCVDGVSSSGVVVGIGFYGEALRVGYGSMGGWDAFGPMRQITKSKGNVLFELDGKPALALYKEYLGDQAAGLPATGLLFPLNMQVTGSTASVVRTILAVSEADGSMTFAGDVPEGAAVQLMRANFDRLIDGAGGAAEGSVLGQAGHPIQLAVLISCVGRKLVLKQRVEEELESVASKVGNGAAMTGFYSYGEICPVAPTERQCELHNQTMTITCFSE